MGRSYGSRHSGKGLLAPLLAACGFGLPVAGQSLVRGRLIAQAMISAHQMNSTQLISAGIGGRGRKT